jgi:hypothetical protein
LGLSFSASFYKLKINWEQINNPDFNYGEFAIIRNKAGLNSFKISVSEFVKKTSAISLHVKAGRYGGTYAHKDIAFQFAMWISPEFAKEWDPFTTPISSLFPAPGKLKIKR